MCQCGFEICSATQIFSVSKAPGLSAISLNFSQRYFKEFVKQTRADSSKLTNNTDNGQRNSPLPSAPIRTTEDVTEFVGLFMDLVDEN